ncbi:terminase small subunit protein [Mesorhizobium sp. NPDC059025]|uniref:terminase small subunit-like protein n=1 Tax=unclassified Mesorhizobium TaxID=325217 RepID=UPI003683780D
MANSGRPTDYSPALVGLICERIADGESLRSICLDDDMPAKATVFRWLAAHEAFRDQYARAREAQADTFFEDVVDIADDGRNDTYKDDEGNARTDHDVIARSRLRVDARKWAASKLNPKKYGEKVALTGDEGGPLQINVVQRAQTRSSA